MKERVLITGASGFVGYHLIEEALRRGLEVHAAVRPTSKIDHLKNLPVNFNYTRLNDGDALKKDFEDKQYQYIVHAAGVVKARNEQAYNETNAEVTRIVAHAAVEAKMPLKKFVLLGSLAAMGPSASEKDIADNDPGNPLTYYGKSKRLAEKYVTEMSNLPWIVLRPTAVYGPRERDVFIILKSIAQGIEPYIGKIDQQLSFIYVKDLAAITIEALLTTVTQRAYNVSDGQRYGRYALADFTKDILKKKTYKFHIPLGIVQAMAGVTELVGNLRGSSPILNRNKLSELTAKNWACSIDNLRQDLDFTPRYNLKQGLEETLQWYKDNKWLN
jgi:nucleoside-diphosphate-sugar epimerase